jgi:hypothetical protein
MEDVQAITSQTTIRTNKLQTNFDVLIFISGLILEFWGSTINPSMLHPYITSKLLSEHTTHKSREKLLLKNAVD